MNRLLALGGLAVICLPALFGRAMAVDGKSAAAREAAEYVMSKFGRQAGQQTVEILSRKIETLAQQHGDEAIEAVKKVGPKVFRIVEGAGEAGGKKTIKLLARFGEDGAVWVVERPRGMAIFQKYGDDGAEALIRHCGIAEPVIDGIGLSAVQALRAVGPQNGRRIAMMVENGELAKIGRTSEVMTVIARYGDEAMDFIWRNKAALATTVVLSSFLADPKPYIDGVKDISKMVAETVVTPIAAVPGRVIEDVTRSINWTTVATWLIFAGALLWAARWVWRRKYLPVKPAGP